VLFDWTTIHIEALARRSELRSQRWQVKKRELELIASRNHLLPRLDAVGRYRWYGAGDDLIDSSGNGISPFMEGSNAFEVLTGGDYQEWEMGVQLSIPIGFRRAMVGVRHHQLLLSRERAVLEDMELEVSHQLGDAIRDIDLNYAATQTNFNRRVAAADEVDAVQTVYEVGNTTLDQLLDAQRRHSEADSAFYRSLVDYNRAIMRVHHRKGSLLEYNGVYLAEGPWPGKAYFDALRRARQRDASTYLDYGFTRPNVISRGAHAQITHQPAPFSNEPTIANEPFSQEEVFHGETTPLENIPPGEEVVPAPEQIESTEPTTDQTAFNEGLSTLPAVEQVEPEFSAILPSNFQTESYLQQQQIPAEVSATPLTVPQYEPQRPALSAQTPIPVNPYRQELVNWNEETPLVTPDKLPPVNPLRQPQPLRQESFNWIRQQQANSDEPKTDRTTFETPANPAGW